MEEKIKEIIIKELAAFLLSNTVAPTGIEITVSYEHSRAKLRISEEQLAAATK